MSIPSNYKYLLGKASELFDKEGSILDYGCGKGVLVEEGIQQGFNIFGCELFGAGSGVTIREQLLKKGLFGTTVREIEDGKIPFPNEYFDLVISNQVFEHVPDLDFVLAEISRVLKPSGKLICVFPVQECCRDHAGTFFAHWFPPNSKVQYYSLLFFRSLGFGRLKKGRGNRSTWAKFFVQWLANNTWYRPLREVRETFERTFGFMQHVEDDYINFRLKERGFHTLSLLSNIPLGKRFFQWICLRWGDAVLIATKA